MELAICTCPVTASAVLPRITAANTSTSSFTLLLPRRGCGSGPVCPLRVPYACRPCLSAAHGALVPILRRVHISYEALEHGHPARWSATKRHVTERLRL